MAVNTVKNRIRWIDCAKAVAILAVVTDHCGTLYEGGMLQLPEGENGVVGLLYGSPLITLFCWFSVSLFILLSGVSAWVSSNGGTAVSYGRQAKRAGRLFCAYALATLAVCVIQSGFFRLEDYWAHLLRFDLQGAFYYVFVLLQLMLIAPLLLRWCRFCNRRRLCGLWHGATTAALCGAAYLCVRYTRMLPLFGGGKFLFGGTYLALYGLGMQLASLGVFSGGVKRRAAVLGASGAALVLWMALMATGALPLDGWLLALAPELLTPPAASANVLGNGTLLSNPPGLLIAVYAVLLLFFLFAGFSLLAQKGGKIGGMVVAAFSWLGRYTLPIYLYHILIRDLLLLALPWETMGMWARRAVFLPCTVLVPALVAAGWRRAKGMWGKKGRTDGKDAEGTAVSGAH